jgi:hypothetical protein
VLYELKKFHKQNIFSYFINREKMMGATSESGIASKDRLAQNQDNVSEWNDMSTRGLLFQ